MNTIETIINTYILNYGNDDEKQLLEVYQGSMLDVFGNPNNDIEESMEFGGIETTLIFSVLTFILQSVGKSIIQDGYKLTREKFLGYLKKDKKKLIRKAKKKELTQETISQLIELLEIEQKRISSEGSNKDNDNDKDTKNS